MGEWRFDEEIRARICDRYLLGESSGRLARELECDPTTIRLVLERAGITRRGAVESHRKHSCNHRFFERIDTEEKAYWLGFITADGCVTAGNMVQVILAACDADHLLKLKTALSATQPVSIGRAPGEHFIDGKATTSGPTARFVVYSKEMYDDLGKLGVLPRKSVKETPAVLDTCLMRHYWRGVIDGDGWVGGSQRYWRVGVVGSIAICDGFAEFARDVTGATSNTVPIQNHFRFCTSGSHGPYLLAKHLYEGAAVYLDRKYAKYQELVRWYKAKYPPAVKPGEQLSLL